MATNKQLLININNRLFKLEKNVGVLNERTTLLPKLYDNVDKLISEIVDSRQHRILINNRLSKLEAEGE